MNQILLEKSNNDFFLEKNGIFRSTTTTTTTAINTPPHQKPILMNYIKKHLKLFVMKVLN